MQRTQKRVYRSQTPIRSQVIDLPDDVAILDHSDVRGLDTTVSRGAASTDSIARQDPPVSGVQAGARLVLSNEVDKLEPVALEVVR